MALFAGMFSGLPGEIRFLFLLASIIAVPVFWIQLRGEKSIDPEGDYPDPSVSPTPDVKFGEFPEDILPTAEAGVYGPTRSGAGYYSGYLTKREWVHPDFDGLRRSQKKRLKDSQQKKNNEQEEEP